MTRRFAEVRRHAREIDMPLELTVDLKLRAERRGGMSDLGSRTAPPSRGADLSVLVRAGCDDVWGRMNSKSEIDPTLTVPSNVGTHLPQTVT